MLWNLKMYFSSMLFLLTGCVVSMISSLSMISGNYCYFIEWEILNVGSCSLEASFIFDWMSMMFMSFVSFISSMVLYYSGGYMSGDKDYVRFMYIVLGFVASMGFLIISPNLVSILLGWDGLGLVSYALVIYYQNEKSANAGMLTALSNRIGDVAILLSIALMFNMGGWDFIFYMENSNMLPVIFLVVLAAMTKSAQVPFSAWLPAAMAAPTPVSALVHSSTLVTAGVYLLIRFSPLLMGTSAQNFLLLLASITMFMAGLGANFETDLKKIIALSTLSQLGVMMGILALGWPGLAFFHLLAHALFKALLFMCAGSIIHSAGGYQDIRFMGGLVYFMPMSVMSINISNLALCGTPFLAGFYSKDLILEIAFSGYLNEICFWLLVLSTGLSVCYTFRLVYYTLSGDFNLMSTNSVSDEDLLMTNPMIGLALGAVCGGAVLSWLIFPSPEMICLEFSFKILALSVSLIGGLIGYFINIMASNWMLKMLSFYNVVSFSSSMWFMPFLSTVGASKGVLAVGVKCYEVSDSGWSEYYGGQGIFNLSMKFSKYFQKVEDSGIKIYLMITMMWLIAMMIIM
uniref:NADH dehydrogenase subunit 5 n=1 Tax=Plesionika izumiae TaxID=309573 RepID=UPI0023D81BBC|nr:NADH dehydrogenase subunit 5 [Plesionika izumiae]WDD39134.1 NADH dehydrogenase subunit 5 [Plesionika izumiae]